MCAIYVLLNYVVDKNFKKKIIIVMNCICAINWLFSFLTGGFERSEGVMFVWFTNKFGKGAQITSLPGAVCSTITLLLG